MKKLLTLILSIILCFSFASCSGKFVKEKDILNIKNPTGKIYLKVYDEELEKDVYEASFEFELFYKDAPNTVTNFINLINSGYYTGKVFELAGNDPFVNFGEREFINEPDEDDPDTILKYKDTVKHAYNIVGEFSNNKWDKNTQTAAAGSMMMMRETDSAKPESKYDTAYAGFRIQTEVTAASIKKEYEKDYCIFGKITKLNDGKAFSSGDFEKQLVDNFFERLGISDNYDGSSARYKFMISKIEINDIIDAETGAKVTLKAPKKLKAK